MNLLHITDLGKGRIGVSWQRGNEIARTSPRRIRFRDPLTAEDRVEFRWYLEDYLQFPYGAEEDRAARVEQRMIEWGESLFSQVFVKGRADPDPRAFYQEAVREGLECCELCITSEEAAFLNIPWELMRDPTPGRGYLAPLLAGLYRQRSGQKIEAPLPLSAKEAFRILLVIARPYGERDVPLGTVARPMLEALRPLGPHVCLEVLRPPTFDALQERLNARPGYYHLVHFDGHGVFARSSSGSALMQFGAAAGRGHLVFEKEDGTEHVVNSGDLGQVLARCNVPLFVLNACQSGEEGQADPFSSVASQLVAIGAKGVVAMSYSVYASAASRFMERFYQELVNHRTLSEAVGGARRRLYAEPERESIVGNLELRDWMVPVLYQQEHQFVPIPERGGAAAAEEPERPGLRRRSEEVCPEGRFGFIGRDYDLLRIERALRDDATPWALITGMGGIGKTELAFGFARWYEETGGCPGGVFAASFKEKADFGQVIGSIVGYGTDFSRLSEQEQWSRLVSHLRDNRCLLVWDNFETVAGYPGETPRASDEERARLARFLKALRGGKSRVLITTRKRDENWLGIGCEAVEMRGLNERDAAQLAKAVLKTVGRRPEDFRRDPEYARLIRLLRGHPRSLEVVLPQLWERSPGEIIEALQHRIDELGEAVEDASLGDAFAHLSARTRKHLPFMGLFASYVHAGTLAAFVGGAHGDRVYTEIVGEGLDERGWEGVLDEAGRCGLICPLGHGLYELHPTLIPFLRRQLASALGEEGVGRLDTEYMKFYAAWAAHYHEHVRRAEEQALMAVAIEEANLLRALRVAELNEEWSRGQYIVQTLCELYEARGRTDEWRAIRDRLLGSVGREMSADADRDRAALWMFLLGDEANDALARNELDQAEAAHERVLQYLVSLNDAALEPKVAVAYHQLGAIAQERQDFEGAEDCYGKALGIRERLGLEPDAADDYHQLGMIAQERQRFDQAEDWYGKALGIFERLGLERYAATVYHQLGLIAQQRDRLDEAEEWYRRALEIRERLGLERGAAMDDHQLGNVAYLRHCFDEAEERYRKALEIRERLGLERNVASDYHQLGMIAEERQDFDGAEGWYRKALEVCKRLGLERDAADQYHQLGIIAQKREDFDGAEGWCRTALEVYERLAHPPLMVDTLAQYGVLMRKWNRPEKAVAWFGKALAIAAEYKMRVAGQILAHLALEIQPKSGFWGSVDRAGVV